MVDQTIVAAALPAIAGELRGADRISWIVTGYLVAASVAAPVYGRVGDLLGRKRLMYVALIVVIVASVICALATSIEMLAAARVLQGIGGGGLMTLSQALVGEAVPPRDRVRYGGFMAALAVSSSTFGALAGGLLTAQFGWRSVFLVGIPVGLLAMVLLRRLPTRMPTSSGSRRFDGPGLVLFATFIVSSLAVLNQFNGARPDLLLAGAVFALCIAAVVLLIWREKRATNPLFPIPLFSNPTIWRCDALAICNGATLVSLITFLPIYFRVGAGADAAAIGFLILPVTAGVPIGSIITGQLVARSGRTAIFPSIGLIFVVALFAVVGIWLPHFGPHQVAWLLGACSLFLGTVMNVVQVTVQTAAGPHMLGTASASVQYSRSIGAAIGTAAVSAILFATLAARDGEAAQVFMAILQRGPNAMSVLPELRRVVVRQEIADAFRAAFFTMGAFAAVGLGLAWALPLRRL
jgi:MFS family permease